MQGKSVESTAVGSKNSAERQIAFVPPPPKNLEHLITARSGDTFMKLMTGATVSRADAHRAITALRKVYNPRDLRPGQTLIALVHKPETAGAKTGKREEPGSP